MPLAKKIVLVSAIWLFCITQAFSQACTGLGQTPATAFPVCGTSVFRQTSVPVCSGKVIPTQCNDGTVYKDVNPYWYKFTCYSTGTLGFVITPQNAGDDYDWQLFDITGHDASEVYTNAALIVSSNWSGSPGATGASPTGTNPFECSSDPRREYRNTFSNMPTITAGHDYLLMISHFDGATQSGYTLSYPSGAQGGTASIVNPIVPSVLSAYAVCDGTEIVLKMNKKVNCSSIAADGSDFTATGPAPITIASVTGAGCSNGFDSDTLLIKINEILSPGTYQVNAKAGSDGNTVTDNCSNSLTPGNVATIQFIASLPTPMDSITPPVCITDSITLVFRKPMKCSSIATDGSDFFITGPATVTVKSATGNCTNGLTTSIKLLLSAPIRVNGTFTVHLQSGSDGNTLIDECAQSTPAGSTASFTTKNIAAADFIFTVAPGCVNDSLSLVSTGNGVSQWQWLVDNVLVARTSPALYTSSAFGSHVVKLITSSASCTDSLSKNFIFPDQTVKAIFQASADTTCPMDTLHFIDLSIGGAIGWSWDFGNGQTSTLLSPPAQTYAAGNRATNYTVKLVVNSNTCKDSTYHAIHVLKSCYIAVPGAFTPNGDGLNDYLYPLNAEKASNLVFRVYNRAGQILFESRSAGKKWDGRYNGQLQETATYVWTLDYTDVTKQQKVSMKGTTVLIR